MTFANVNISRLGRF